LWEAMTTTVPHGPQRDRARTFQHCLVSSDAPQGLWGSPRLGPTEPVRAQPCWQQRSWRVPAVAPPQLPEGE